MLPLTIVLYAVSRTVCPEFADGARWASVVGSPVTIFKTTLSAGVEAPRPLLFFRTALGVRNGRHVANFPQSLQQVAEPLDAKHESGSDTFRGDTGYLPHSWRPGGWFGGGAVSIKCINSLLLTSELTTSSSIQR